jgi:hypothetical protein
MKISNYNITTHMKYHVSSFKNILKATNLSKTTLTGHMVFGSFPLIASSTENIKVSKFIKLVIPGHQLDVATLKNQLERI